MASRLTWTSQLLIDYVAGSVVPKTVTSTVTQVTSIVNPQLLVQQAQLQRVFAQQLATLAPQAVTPAINQPLNLNSGIFTNNLLPALNNNPINPINAINFNQNQIKPQLVTKEMTTVVTTTATNTKIYTLVYNAFSTKYRTVTSTSVYPTTVTTHVTETVAPTANPFALFG